MTPASPEEKQQIETAAIRDFCHELMTLVSDNLQFLETTPPTPSFIYRMDLATIVKELAEKRGVDLRKEGR